MKLGSAICLCRSVHVRLPRCRRRARAVATRRRQVPPGVLEEIIVTAQRREETLQKSSLSIQVVSDDELWRAGVAQASDLNRLVPGIQIAGGGNAAQIYIRGVGDFAASPLSNPAVAVNVDGVYISRPQGVNSSFYDLERLEVLRGPQGTLYGRNASGGALNLITNRPSLDCVERLGRASGLGNYSLFEAQGAINVPLGDTVAIRAAANVVQRDGYLSDDTNDEDTTAGRVRLLWQPSETCRCCSMPISPKRKAKAPATCSCRVRPGPTSGSRARARNRTASWPVRRPSASWSRRSAPTRFATTRSGT